MDITREGMLGIDRFGASAEAADLLAHPGLTPKRVGDEALRVLGEEKP
jgi:transketolase